MFVTHYNDKRGEAFPDALAPHLHRRRQVIEHFLNFDPELRGACAKYASNPLSW